MQLIADLLAYGATFSIIFLISFACVMSFDKESRAEFIQEVTGS